MLDIYSGWDKHTKRTKKKKKSTYVQLGFPSFAVVQKHPVVDAVLNLVHALQCLGEQVSQKVVVWSLLERQLANIVQVDTELL